MKGYGRSIAYWGWFVEKYFLLMLGTILVIVAAMGLLNEDYNMMNMIPTYLPMMGAIVVIVCAFNGPIYFIPQAISLGGTRKETFIGMEIMIHVLTLQYLILIVIGVKVMPLVADADSLPYLYNMDIGFAAAGYAVMLLLCCGIGNLICACGLKFGFKGQMIIYLVSVLLIIGVVIGITFAGDFQTGLEIEEIFQKLAVYGILGAILLDALMIVLCYFGIRKFAVKA